MNRSINMISVLNLRIMRAAKTAAECYGLGQKVKNYNHAHWMTKATSSLLEVNKLKFSQHPDLAEFLKKTGTTHIVEARHGAYAFLLIALTFLF